MLTFLHKRSALLVHAGIYPALILLVNLWIVAKEFKVDYTSYLESNEGSFIAIARNLAAHPFDMLWWPQWDLGIPFQNTYIPGLHMLVAAFSRLTGHSAGLSFHQVCAALFALGPVAVYFMAWMMTRLPGTSWFAALAYSLVTPSGWLMPVVRKDMNGPWNLRRLQIFAYYGEGPHTACLFFVPLAILFLYLALTRGALWAKIAAGLCIGLAVSMNAFAAVILGIAALALIAASPDRRRWSSAGLVLTIAALAYLWISPLLPPSVAADIRGNSVREYPFNGVSALGLGDLAVAYYFLWRATKTKATAPVQIFALITLPLGCIVLFAYYAGCNLVPQPLRYSTTLDMGLCLCAVFGGAALLRRFSASWLRPVTVILVLAAILQGRHDVRYGRGLIRQSDVTATTAYHLAKWADTHLEGQRVFIGGAQSFHFNAFTDTPQFHGGHDPMMPSILTLHGSFVIASGMGTGSRDMEICTVWLKALGTHAFSVPGPISDPYYHEIPSPERFEGHFPVLWRESDTTLYGVPTRSTSLAHVVPPSALIRHFPENGLDVAEMSRYVDAIEEQASGDVPFHWVSRHAATIHAKLQPGQLISIQERYAPGWTATVNGHRQDVEADGIGFMVLKPSCDDCQVTISYDGGIEWRAVCVASLLVTLFCGFAVSRSLVRRFRSRPAPAPAYQCAP